MNYTLVWKEWREQRNIWIGLAVATAVFVTLATWAGFLHVLPFSTDPGQAVRTICLTFAVIYGVISGSMLLAGEGENRTMAFLDCLPCERSRVWKTKMLTSFLLALLQAVSVPGALYVALPALRWPGVDWAGGWLLVGACLAIEGVVWGALASALQPTVFRAAILAGIALLVNWPVTTYLIMQSYKSHYLPVENGRVFLATIGLRIALDAAALFGSWRLFLRRDVARKRAYTKSRWIVIWLALRQRRPAAWTLIAAGFLVGLLFFGVSTYLVDVFLWPWLTLVIGIVAGVLVFAGDGTDRYRFLADQRLPPGRIWRGKTLVSLLLAIGFCVTVTLGMVTHALARTVLMETHDSLYGATFSPRETAFDNLTALLDMLAGLGSWRFLTLWFAYGFAIGLIMIQWVRKPLVAILMAAPTGLMLAQCWVPSLMTGGLSYWQAFVPFGIILLTTRLVMPYWIRGQLGSAKPLAFQFGAALLILLGTTGSLCYRAIELPATPPPFDAAAFVRQMRQNEASASLSFALTSFTATEKMLSQQDWGSLEYAWQAMTGSDLGRMYDDTWLKPLADLPAKKLAVLEDAKAGFDSKDIRKLRRMAGLLTVRAAQSQWRGNGAAALKDVAVLLALSRDLRYHSGLNGYESGLLIENSALDVLEIPGSSIGTVPEFMERALAELKNHESLLPTLSDNLRIEYLRTLGYSSGSGKPSDFTFAASYAMNLSMVQRAALGTTYERLPEPPKEIVPFGSLSWISPWEMERRERILNRVYAEPIRFADKPYWEIPRRYDWRIPHIASPRPRIDKQHPAPGPVALREWMSEDKDVFDWVESPWWNKAIVVPPWSDCILARNLALSRVRGTRIQLALELRQLREGKQAKTLDDLVPRYLAELPLDPFSGQSFRYRAAVATPFGIDPGLVWSVGPYQNEPEDYGRPDFSVSGFVGVSSDLFFPVARLKSSKSR